MTLFTSVTSSPATLPALATLPQPYCPCHDSWVPLKTFYSCHTHRPPPPAWDTFFPEIITPNSFIPFILLKCHLLNTLATLNEKSQDASPSLRPSLLTLLYFFPWHLPPFNIWCNLFVVCIIIWLSPTGAGISDLSQVSMIPSMQ